MITPWTRPETDLTESSDVPLIPCVLIAREIPLRHHRREMLDTTQSDAAPPKDEPRGCLFALSQPPLMIFLAVIGCLLLMASLHDLLLL